MMKTNILLFILTSIVNFVKAQPPKIFLNCTTDNCYENFIKQELSGFDFVRDRFQADLQILIAKQISGNGGSQYSLYFLPTSNQSKDTVVVESLAADSENMIREKLLIGINKGLYYYCHNKDCEHFFNVQMTKDIRKRDSLQDPWRYWVFAPAINGMSESESNYTWIRLGAELSIRKVSEKHKLIVSSRYENDFNRIVIDSVMQNTVKNGFIYPLYAHSINQHWSVGGLARIGFDHYRNIKAGFKIAPLLEYNIFPMHMNARKQLRFAYQAGFHLWKYRDTTIYEKIHELRPYHKLSVIAEVTQPWGSLKSSLHGSTYLDNLSQYRVTFENQLSVRLIEGLAFNIEVNISYIQDQISLLKNELPEAIYLLYGQQLPTTFHFYSQFGFSYTFGSIFNNIVNPRFGQVD